MAPVVHAYDLKHKKHSVMKNPKPVYTVTSTGSKRYRLEGTSTAGTKMTKPVTEETAKEYGVPKKVEAKVKKVSTRAPRKTCKEKYDDCTSKAPARRGAKVEDLEVAIDDLAEAASDVSRSAKKVARAAKTKKAKKVAQKVEGSAEKIADATDEIAEALASETKKAPAKRGRPAGKKAPAKKAPAKKAGAKKAPAKRGRPAGKKAPAKKAGAKKAGAKKAAKKK